jgi:hypothetical protein
MGKSSLPEDSLELKTQLQIEYLLKDDPFDLEFSDSCQTLEEKCELLSKYFKKRQKLKEYKSETFKPEPEKTPKNKRKILLKFLDNRQEDEILNKDLSEIPIKLKEEIEHSKQILRNLLVKDMISQQKMQNYLEILYECGLLKVHSDPVCLFIHDDEYKGVFEEILKLTRLSNMFKTFMLRVFLAMEDESEIALNQLKQEVFENGFLLD